MITFYCRMAGWGKRFNITLDLQNSEYVLTNCKYQIDLDEPKIGNIDLNMTLKEGGTWKKECYLIFDSPISIKFYPGNKDDKVKVFDKVKIPKESISQLLSFLNSELLYEKSVQPILDKAPYTLLFKKYKKDEKSEIVIHKEEKDFKLLVDYAEVLNKTVEGIWTKEGSNCANLLEWDHLLLNSFDQGSIIIVKTQFVNKYYE